MVDVDVKKSCPVLLIVALVTKQSVETLKMLLNFQMMKKGSLL